MEPDSRPVLVGVGELTQRADDPHEALDPLSLMERAARLAFDDAGAAELAARVDCVGVVATISWHYPDPTRQLAERLDLRPGREIVTTWGGNSPQLLVNQVAERIRAGRLRGALLAGGEAVRSRRRARQLGVELAWPRGEGGGAGRAETLGDDRPGTSEFETSHGLTLPPFIYPLFENALRAREGRSVAAHAERLGRILSRFSQVASENPNAWFREKRSAEEIAVPTQANRMVCFPYTKYMNAIMEVDQGAALLLTSAGEARALGIPEARWVWFWGGGEASEDPWFVTERPRLDACPALAASAGRALARARLDVEEIDCFDLYSCFPSAIEMACLELGIDPLGERPLTVTGGLPYAGGPGNNYSMHAVARMVERLREKPGAHGLVTALGWYLTKHAAGVYASAPPPEPGDASAVETPRAEPVPIAERAEGRGTLESYTVLHERDGTPRRGIVLGRLDDGRRFLAKTEGDRAVLEELMAEEGVGRRGRVRPDEATNLFTLEDAS